MTPDTAARLAAIALTAADDILDELIALPEPLDTIADTATGHLLVQLAELMRRDPAKMRKRAARAEARGNIERATRIRERADELDSRRD